MSRRGLTKTAAGAQVFPFLAVLICTMGSLVVLLTVVSRQASSSAIAAAQAQAQALEADAETIAAERELGELRVSQLKAARDKSAAQLQEERLKLSHLEDHLRRLREQVAGLRASAEELDRLGSASDQQRGAAAAELSELKTRIAAAQRDLSTAESQAQNRQVSYSVIPYEGPNETRRRPIYIECLLDSVVIQPEGITLYSSDFEGPLGPGNPLAAALRAIREQVAAQEADAGAEKSEPYPLLLVRPDGIVAYYAARTALASWGSEFGYEMVEQDWKLEFPPSDPRLVEATRLALEEARVRQKQLAASAPRHYPKSAKPTFHARPRGGFEQQGGPRGRGGRGGGDFPWDKSMAAGRGSRAGGSGGGNGIDETGETDSGNSLGGGAGSDATASAAGPYGDGRYGDGRYGDGRSGQLNGSEGGGGGAGTDPISGQSGSGKPGSATPGDSVAGGKGTGPYDSLPDLSGAGTQASGGSAQGTSAQGSSASQTGTQASGTQAAGTRAAGSGESGSPDSKAQGGQPGAAQLSQNKQPGSSGSNGLAEKTAGANGNQRSGGNGDNLPHPADVALMHQQKPATGSQGSGGTSNMSGPQSGNAAQNTGAKSSGSNSPSSGGAASGGPGGPSGQPGSPDDANQQNAAIAQLNNRKKPASLAQSRGNDWGLPDAGHGSVPVTRPIVVECRQDRLIILPEQGTGGGKTIPIVGATQDSVDDLVSSVWQYMKGWGIAGRGLYWKPTLVMVVAPGGERRYAELESLLNDSGLEVKQRTAKPSVADNSKNKRK